LVSETTASYDVVGFYISFILVIGKVIRSIISGEETRIILTEMPEPESLMTLCEGIKISRYRRDFVKEEYLFYVLIDLMRSPEIIKIITKSCIRKIKEKSEIEKKNE
jgi:piezo-type mechanosensitive ion channel component 1/2